MRKARVKGFATGKSLSEAVAAYLPSNYRVTGTDEDGAVLIEGEDNAGWTLDDYVMPRLASGLYFAEEIIEGND